MYDILIIGAGAAGMMAAVAAGETAAHHACTLRIGMIEKNDRPGIKVLVCGGGRCNFTNSGSVDDLITQFGRNGRFLTPALWHLDNQSLRDWFSAHGVPSHEEPGGKIYPDSNQASSVVNALLNRMHQLDIDVHAGDAVQNVTPHENGEGFRITTTHAQYECRRLLIAVGGMSYQRMGTTGDGYRFAQSLGHSIVTPRPAIVGLLCKQQWAHELQGLAVPDVEVRIDISGTLPKLATGKPTPSVHDMLFTHFGLSGPAVLNISEIVAELLEKINPVRLKIDFARNHSHDQLAALMRHWQQAQGKKQLRTLLTHSAAEITINTTSPDQTWATTDTSAGPREFGIPRRLADKFCELEQINPEQLCSQLTSAQIHKLVERIKGSHFDIHATRGFKEAMVTAGGVSLKEVDPQSMCSKILSHLYLAGEVLDLTGPSGGYNLQLAFSTGHLAGASMAESLL